MTDSITGVTTNLSGNGHPPRSRVLILGLDGITFDLLQPWIDSGELPTLRRLMQNGASGLLRTTVPPISSSAWVSFATGTNPGKHGLVDFVYPRPGGYDAIIVNSTSRMTRTMWSILSQAGKKVGVVAVPVTYPPEAVNGFMVTDFLTPSQDAQFTHPPELKDELRQAMGEFLLFPNERWRSTPHVDRFVADLRAAVDNRTQAVQYLMKNKEWDFLCAVYWSPDMLQHDTWRHVDPTHPQHDPKVAGRARADVLGYFKHLDASVNRLIADAGPEALVMIMSDHGFGPTHYFFLVNTWLHRLGLLQFKRAPFTLFKQLLFNLGFTPLNAFRIAKALNLGFLRKKVRFQKGGRLMKRLFLSFADVDWERTKAFAVGSFGQIYINLKGKQAQGIVEPGEEYEALRALIIHKALELRHPATGRPVVQRGLKREEVYHGAQLERMPDVVLETQDFLYMAFGHADFGSNQIVETVAGLSGHHRPDGVVMLAGPGVRPGARLEGAKILDLAPTVLYALGVPVPAEMDGRVLTEAFTPDYQAAHSVAYSQDEITRDVSYMDESDEDEEIIRSRLRGFGYVS